MQHALAHPRYNRTGASVCSAHSPRINISARWGRICIVAAPTSGSRQKTLSGVCQIPDFDFCLRRVQRYAYENNVHYDVVVKSRLDVLYPVPVVWERLYAHAHGISYTVWQKRTGSATRDQLHGVAGEEEDAVANTNTTFVPYSDTARA